MNDKLVELKRRYDNFALSNDETTTASDFLLRELEISYALEFIRNNDVILDVGCGPGVALQHYSSARNVDAYGIDFSENMIDFAIKRTSEMIPDTRIDYKCASVTELPYEDNKFDIVTSHRCLMALLDWAKQKEALLEIHRVLKPGGIFVMMEGTFDGLEKLNFYRRKFDLPEIEADGRDRLLTLKFHEKDLMDFCRPHYELLRTQRFGMYYFLTRIVQPLLVSPESPSYDHPLNKIARTIADIVPDFEGIGHLVGFALRKIVS